MIYRTFALETLEAVYQTDELKETLSYGTSGAVADFVISDDYMVQDNNSEITIVADTTAEIGQIVVLIQSSGAFAMGVVTAVDNEKHRIMFKSIFDLFNDNALNPMRATNTADKDITYCYDAIDDTATMLLAFFGGVAQEDKYRRLPLIIRTSGGGISNGQYNEPAIWNYKDNSFNVRQWLVSLFDSNNVVVQTRLVFEISRAYIELYIFKNDKSGRLIKNNIQGMTILQNESRTTNATVCQVIYASDKGVVPSGMYYLLADNTVTTNMNASNRVQPYKLVVSEFDKEQADADKQEGKPVATPQSIAENALRYKDFSHYVSIEIDRNSGMYPHDINIGDAVIIAPKMLSMQVDTPLMTADEYDKYLLPSIYTGRKESSNSSRVTLIFGKIRVSMTDLLKIESYNKVRR